MTTAQKIIKYLAIAFAIFLIFTIISGILSGIYGLITGLGLIESNNADKGGKYLSIVEWDQYDEAIKKLNIDVNYSNFTIKESDTIKIESNINDIDCKQNGNTLEIKEKNHIRFNFGTVDSTREIILYIPRDLILESSNISTGSGRVNIEYIHSEDLDLNLGAGETTIKELNVKHAKIDTGAGDFKIENGNINDLDFNQGVGETDIRVKLTGKNKFNMGIGTLKIHLLNNKDDYKINVDNGIGNVKIDGKDVSDNETIGNGQNHISISGGIGEIYVDFI